MASIRVRYENGQFIALSDTSSLSDGDEFTLVPNPPTHQLPPISPERRAAVSAALAESAGAWRDIDIDIEAELSAMRQEDDEAWQNKMGNLGIW